MAKRTATSELNHENWNQEEDTEEAGTFARATEDALQKRVIKVAKRRNPISAQNEEGGSNAFGDFSGFGKAPKTTATKQFGFLSNLSKSNGTSPEKNLDEYYSKLKGLNESVCEWIKTHVDANPLINLQPVFKDYDKYIVDLEKLKTDGDSTASKPQFSFGSATGKSSGSFSFSTATVSNSGSTSGSDIFKKSPNSDKEKFSFSSIVVKPADKVNFSNPIPKPAEEKVVEDDEDEPPKVEISPVVEEGHIYSIRCKVFVKKDGNFSDHGVGTLYLKPVQDSEKVQLIVRAETNLGRLLCNFILSESIPTKRMGKKDVMLVCVVTPDTKPPPVPVLIRVKSTEDADELLKTLEKHKK